MSGNLSSSMLSSTFPTKPVLPRMNRFRPRKISVGDRGGVCASGAVGSSMQSGGFIPTPGSLPTQAVPRAGPPAWSLLIPESTR